MQDHRSMGYIVSYPIWESIDSLKKLEEKYGSKVQEWVSRIGKERFFKYDYQVQCGEYFADNNSYQFDQKSVEEFKIFLDEYKVNELNVEYEN